MSYDPSVYSCAKCHRRTRESGEGESEFRLCHDCYDNIVSPHIKFKEEGKSFFRIKGSDHSSENVKENWILTLEAKTVEEARALAIEARKSEGRIKGTIESVNLVFTTLGEVRSF